MLRKLVVVTVATMLAIAVMGLAPGAFGQGTGEALVNVGSPRGPFSQNKQNEPAVAVDAAHPERAGGRCERRDRRGGVQRRRRTTPVRSPTESASRASTSRSTADAAGPSRPTRGGAPATAWGPATPTRRASRRRADRHGAEVLRERAGLRRRPRGGVRAETRPQRILVEQRLPFVLREPDVELLDPADPSAASRPSRSPAPTTSGRGGGRHAGAWLAPVADLAGSRTTTFSDKEQVWADNAESSPFFGNRLRLLGELPRPGDRATPLPAPLMVATSPDGGDTWTLKQVGPAPQQRPVTTHPTAAPSGPTVTDGPTSSAWARRLRTATRRSR